MVYFKTERTKTGSYWMYKYSDNGAELEKINLSPGRDMKVVFQFLKPSN